MPTIRYFVLCTGLICLMVPFIQTVPVTLPEEITSVPNEEMELVPVDVIPEDIEDNGEDMDTAMTRYYSDYYYRPVYAYRRVHSNRRRVHVPRRRYGYDDGDRFPTVA